jgi:hypothetical protein
LEPELSNGQLDGSEMPCFVKILGLQKDPLL